MAQRLSTLHLGPSPNGIAENMVVLLDLWHRGQLHEHVINRAANLACWWVSNQGGKGDHCPWWSLAARAKRAEWYPGKWPSQHGLVHEHVVPRSTIIEELMRLPPGSAPQTVADILSLSFYCIVIGKENDSLRDAGFMSTMPQPWRPGGNVWARYDAIKPCPIARRRYSTPAPP